MRGAVAGGTCAPKTPEARERPYLLSNLDLHLLSRHVNIRAREVAKSWQADEAGLLL
jgi:hypothetical protein